MTIIMTAGDLMKRDLSAVLETDTVADALRVLHSHRLSGVPVVDAYWRLVGFFSEADALELALPTTTQILQQESFLFDEEKLLSAQFARIYSQPVSKYMQRPPLSVHPSAHILSVAQLMLDKKLYRIAVTDRDVLVGVLDQSDFCEYLLAQVGPS